MDKKKDKPNQKWVLECFLVAVLVIFAIVLFYDVVSTPVSLVCFRVGSFGVQKILYHIELLILLSIVIIAISLPLRLNSRKLFVVLSFLLVFWLLITFFAWVFVSPLCPATCTFPAGISCINDELHANGELDLTIGQGTGHAIKITGITCTQSQTQPSYVNNYASDPILIASGSSTYVSKSGTPHTLICTDANGNTANLINGSYNGRMYLNYTEIDTGMQRITEGVYYGMLAPSCWEEPFSCIGETNNILSLLLILLWSILGIYIFFKHKQA